MLPCSRSDTGIHSFKTGPEIGEIFTWMGALTNWLTAELVERPRLKIRK